MDKKGGRYGREGAEQSKYNVRVMMGGESKYEQPGKSKLF